MPGRRLSRDIRMKLRAGQSVRLVRGWKRDPAATPAGPCRRISPADGTVIGEFQPHRIEVPAGQLRIRPGWRRRRIMVRRLPDAP